jgi:[ribosomal protein S5]-alanine N-acetyltransferase
MGGNQESYFLTTARVGFRHWRESDLPLALALWGDPRVNEFLGGPFSTEQIRARLASEILLQCQHNFQYWPIFLLDDGEHVGCCGLRSYQPANGIHELGFHLRPQYWGCGIAAEAASAVIGHAFTALGAQALFAGHYPANKRSGRVLLKLGFEYQGMQTYPPTGMLEPTYLLRNQ